MDNSKCVLIIDEKLPLGIIANTAAILGVSLGRQLPQLVGSDVIDSTGNTHLGIIELPVPVLRGNAESLNELRAKLYAPEFADLTVVDFSGLAQSCRTYPEFIDKMQLTAETDLHYLGLAICGTAKKVNKLTGSMALLR